MPGYSDIAAGRYGASLELNAGVYPLEGIQLAASSLLDEGFFYLYGDGGGKAGAVNVAMKPRRDGMGAEALEAAFIVELNRQSLRIHMAKMNRKVRVQVIGRALTSALPVEDGEG